MLAMGNSDEIVVLKVNARDQPRIRFSRLVPAVEPGK
jgi:hypothetical protein